MAALSDRPVYNREQLIRYIAFLQKKCRKFTLDELEADIKKQPLKTLEKLQRRQMASVPFGSLILHYSQHHTISLDEAALFTKIVERGLGGYCMENNTFFAAILRSLGYQVLTTGARISKALDTGGKDMNGFKGCQRMWVFESRTDKESPWTPAHCFLEIEFIPNDFEVINFKTSSSRTSWFTYRFVLNSIIIDQETDAPIGAMIMIGGEVKRRLHGKSEVVEVCKTEAERIRALKKWFEIELKEDEIRGIRGMASDLG
ncbi:MAG: hypothetical protein Q9160_001394 [Pyrenula sp. 1 TL-2023]